MDNQYTTILISMSIEKVTVNLTDEESQQLPFDYYK